jgi:hypothetical protein
MKILKIIFLVLVLYSCSSDDKKDQDRLLAEVMAIHDEMMPAMGKINKFKKQAEVKSKEFLTDSVEINDEKAMALENLALELDAANESMMDWMRRFSNDFEGMENEEIMDYLRDQKVEVKKVKSGIQKSMKNAEVLLEG